MKRKFRRYGNNGSKMDIFDNKDIEPMLIGEECEPFDSADWLYELKLDGERCIAYLSSDSTELRNKRNEKMLPKMPELSNIHTYIKNKCILDGELSIIKNGQPDFFEIQRRSLMSNPIKIGIASKINPACYTAFDILYYENRPTVNMSLTERKELLKSVIISESPLFAYSRYIEYRGTDFFELAKKQNLEGIVAKKKDSLYYFGKRTKEWLKIKNMKDDDFVVCGYIFKENYIISIVLGQYNDEKLIYKGHVTTGVGGESFKIIEALPKNVNPPFAENIPSSNNGGIWVEPCLLYTSRCV